MRRIAVIIAGLLIFAGTVLIGAGTSQASPIRNPLSITGSVVAGVTSVQAGQDVVFDFKIKNHGSAAAVVDFGYTWAHATEEGIGIICPLVSTGFVINPDGTFCEPGLLAPRGSTQSAIVLRASSGAGTVVVIACAGDESNGATPKCISLSVPDVG